MSFRLIMLALTAVTFGFVIGRVSNAFAQCAPGCKVCVLDVCSDAPDAPARGRKPGSGPQQPAAPVPDDPDPLVKSKTALENLKPSDTSDPVTEWVGLSKRDFVNLFLDHFVMAGNCMDVRALPARIREVQRRGDRRDLSAAERDALHKQESELGDKLQRADSAITKRKYDCKDTWKRMDESGAYYGSTYWKDTE